MFLFQGQQSPSDIVNLVTISDDSVIHILNNTCSLQVSGCLASAQTLTHYSPEDFSSVSVRIGLGPNVVSNHVEKVMPVAGL